MKRTVIAIASALALFSAATLGQTPNAPRPTNAKTLDIYMIDTEGGEAILFVSPLGETLLMDTGSPGDRDHARIMEVLKVAGVTRLDYLLSTHYHVDHIGGLAQLAAVMPIGTYVDHGPTVEPREQVANFQATYAALKTKAQSLVVKPGDRLPVAGLDWQIVSAAGRVLTAPLAGAPGAGQRNPACAASAPRDNSADPENAQSVGSVVTYGQFRTIQLGDLLWNNELALMCPENKVGTVDLYLVSHHGTDPSGSPALVHGLRPRVAMMQNGTRKGGTVQTATTLRASAGLEDVWQMHWSYNGLIEHNPAGVFIANIDELPTIAGLLTAPTPATRGAGPGPAAPSSMGPPVPAPPSPSAVPSAAPPIAPPQAVGPGSGVAVAPPQAGATAPGVTGPMGLTGAGRGAFGAAAHAPAHWIKVSAQADGSFTVTNSRNGFSKTYTRR